MTLHVFYAKPEFATQVRVYDAAVVPAKLAETHAKVGEYIVPDSEFDLTSLKDCCERAYSKFQAENWSPNGEARELIRAKGLQHTSMSVGDALVYGVRVYAVVPVGFKFAGYLPVEFKEVV